MANKPMYAKVMDAGNLASIYAEDGAYRSALRVMKEAVEMLEKHVEYLEAVDGHIAPDMKINKPSKINIAQAKKDLAYLDKPVIDGSLNICYSDGIYANSLCQKYGVKSIADLRKLVKGK